MMEVGKGHAAFALAVAALCGAVAGSLGQGQADASREAREIQRIEDGRELERRLAADREANLNQIIESERRHHDESIRGRDTHLAAFSARSVRLRNQLEAMLADSRAANDACTGRIVGISEDIDQLGGLLDQSAGLLEAGQGEIRRLEGENGKLASQVDGLLGEYRACHPERVTVTGAKR